MSEDTLEKLYADFKAVQRKALVLAMYGQRAGEPPVNMAPSPDVFAHQYEAYFAKFASGPTMYVGPPGEAFTQVVEDTHQAYHKARIYMIARDEGLDAAMLYKLQQP